MESKRDSGHSNQMFDKQHAVTQGLHAAYQSSQSWSKSNKDILHVSNRYSTQSKYRAEDQSPLKAAQTGGFDSVVSSTEKQRMRKQENQSASHGNLSRAAYVSSRYGTEVLVDQKLSNQTARKSLQKDPRSKSSTQIGTVKRRVSLKKIKSGLQIVMPMDGQTSGQKQPLGITTQKNEYSNGDVRIIDILKLRRDSQMRQQQSTVSNKYNNVTEGINLDPKIMVNNQPIKSGAHLRSLQNRKSDNNKMPEIPHSETTEMRKDKYLSTPASIGNLRQTQSYVNNTIERSTHNNTKKINFEQQVDAPQLSSSEYLRMRYEWANNTKNKPVVSLQDFDPSHRLNSYRDQLEAERRRDFLQQTHQQSVPEMSKDSVLSELAEADEIGLIVITGQQSMLSNQKKSVSLQNLNLGNKKALRNLIECMDSGMTSKRGSVEQAIPLKSVNSFNKMKMPAFQSFDIRNKLYQIIQKDYNDQSNLIDSIEKSVRYTSRGRVLLRQIEQTKSPVVEQEHNASNHVKSQVQQPYKYLSKCQTYNKLAIKMSKDAENQDSLLQSKALTRKHTDRSKVQSYAQEVDRHSHRDRPLTKCIEPIRSPHNNNDMTFQINDQSFGQTQALKDLVETKNQSRGEKDSNYVRSILHSIEHGSKASNTRVGKTPESASNKSNHKLKSASNRSNHKLKINIQPMKDIERSKDNQFNDTKQFTQSELVSNQFDQTGTNFNQFSQIAIFSQYPFKDSNEWNQNKKLSEYDKSSKLSQRLFNSNYFDKKRVQSRNNSYQKNSVSQGNLKLGKIATLNAYESYNSFKNYEDEELYLDDEVEQQIFQNLLTRQKRQPVPTQNIMFDKDRKIPRSIQRINYQKKIAKFSKSDLGTGGLKQSFSKQKKQQIIVPTEEQPIQQMAMRTGSSFMNPNFVDHQTGVDVTAEENYKDPAGQKVDTLIFNCQKFAQINFTDLAQLNDLAKQEYQLQTPLMSLTRARNSDSPHFKLNSQKSLKTISESRDFQRKLPKEHGSSLISIDIKDHKLLIKPCNLAETSIMHEYSLNEAEQSASQKKLSDLQFSFGDTLNKHCKKGDTIDLNQRQISIEKRSISNMRIPSINGNRQSHSISNSEDDKNSNEISGQSIYQQVKNSRGGSTKLDSSIYISGPNSLALNSSPLKSLEIRNQKNNKLLTKLPLIVNHRKQQESKQIVNQKKLDSDCRNSQSVPEPPFETNEQKIISKKRQNSQVKKYEHLFTDRALKKKRHSPPRAIEEYNNQNQASQSSCGSNSSQQRHAKLSQIIPDHYMNKHRVRDIYLTQRLPHRPQEMQNGQDQAEDSEARQAEKQLEDPPNITTLQEYESLKNSHEGPIAGKVDIQLNLKMSEQATRPPGQSNQRMRLLDKKPIIEHTFDGQKKKLVIKPNFQSMNRKIREQYHSNQNNSATNSAALQIALNSYRTGNSVHRILSRNSSANEGLYRMDRTFYPKRKAPLKSYQSGPNLHPNLTLQTFSLMNQKSKNALNKSEYTDRLLPLGYLDKNSIGEDLNCIRNYNMEENIIKDLLNNQNQHENTITSMTTCKANAKEIELQSSEQNQNNKSFVTPRLQEQPLMRKNLSNESVLFEPLAPNPQKRNPQMITEQRANEMTSEQAMLLNNEIVKQNTSKVRKLASKVHNYQSSWNQPEDQQKQNKNANNVQRLETLPLEKQLRQTHNNPFTSNLEQNQIASQSDCSVQQFDNSQKYQHHMSTESLQTFALLDITNPNPANQYANLSQPVPNTIQTNGNGALSSSNSKKISSKDELVSASNSKSLMKISIQGKL